MTNKKQKTRKYGKECEDVGCIFIDKKRCACSNVVDLCPIDNIGRLESKEYEDALKADEIGRKWLEEAEKQKRQKRKYRVAVDFRMYGEVEVEATSIEEAMKLALDEELPEEKQYLDDSIDVNEEMTQHFAHEDYAQICANCGRSVKKGDGLFVDRVPIATEYEERKEIYNYPDGEFICRECDQTPSDNNP